MQHISLIIALCLIPVALSGRMGRLTALACAWVSVSPAIQPMGLRSAIFAPDLLVAIALIPWLLRSKSSDLPGAPRWYASHLVLIVAWTPIATLIGLTVLGAAGEISYRVPMATLRMAAPLLAFAIPASTTLTKSDFTFLLRVLRYAFILLVALSLADYLHLLPVDFYFQAHERAAKTGLKLSEDAFITRASLGSLCVVGFAVFVLALQHRHGLRALNIGAIVGLIAILLLCQSRSALVATTMFGLTLVLLQKGSRIRNLLIVLVGATTVYAIAISIPFVAERLETLTSAERAIQTSGRIEGYKAALSFLISDPQALVMGVGFDCWSRRLGPLCGLYNGHNVYLHSVAELGLIGGGLYLAFLFRVGRLYFSALRLSKDARQVGGPALGLLCGLAISNLFIVGLYPLVRRMLLIHVTLFILGVMVGRIRYIMAEERLRVSARSQPASSGLSEVTRTLPSTPDTLIPGR